MDNLCISSYEFVIGVLNLAMERILIDVVSGIVNDMINYPNNLLISSLISLTDTVTLLESELVIIL